MNNIVFGQYYNANSWLHRLDPRTKIIGIMTLIISIFLLNDIVSVSVALGFVIVIVLTTKIPISKFLRSLKMMTTLLFITVVFQVIFNTGNNYTKVEFSLNLLNIIIILLLLIFFFASKKIIRKFRFLLFLAVFFLIFYIQTLDLLPFNSILEMVQGKSYESIVQKLLFTYDYSLKFYEQGLITSVIVISRIVALIFLSSILTLTTKPTELNNGLEKLAKPLKLVGVKVSILTMMVSIALRFIPTLINEANKILKAQASRGVDFKEGKLKDKINQIISLLIPMFVISYKRAYDLADAMEARGYIPEAPRTSINVLKLRFSDYLTMFMVFALLSASIVYAIVI